MLIFFFAFFFFAIIFFKGEKNKPSSLLAPSKGPEKMYKIDDHVTTVVAGLSSDANLLINNARVTAQRYIYTYQEPMPVRGPSFHQILNDFLFPHLHISPIQVYSVFSSLFPISLFLLIFI